MGNAVCCLLYICIHVLTCVISPSQLASEGQAAIAQRLTEPLTKSGDVNIIDPHSSYVIPFKGLSIEANILLCSLDFWIKTRKRMRSHHLFNHNSPSHYFFS